MNLKRFLSIPILGVLLLLGFVYYITVFIFIEDWIGLQSSSGSLNAVIFTFLAVSSLFSFSVCVLTDPGHVPPSYAPDVEQSGISDEETKAKICDRCSTYKPPRAHHCRVCRRCVLRMDHHCLWVNNCVGYWNYKAFFMLIFYATIGSIYSTIIVITCSFQKDFNGHAPLKVFYVTCGFMMAALSLTLGTLFGWHIYLIIHNMTTIEYYEGIRAAWMAKKSGQNYRNPFDLNAYKNITLVLGPNMLKWLCPNAVSHLKDGLTFPVSRDNS
ncbi:probable protein S-acyltransferase 15 isoform X2 [Humulus lupulus]|uniref:probable protein S-acyltransferase 15 isoform X2 n=1 Tax=Humulus lupulus TaxID=3486 RepID=UPI002B40E5F9|nr:probable protein S-acyltransferase 15 isoform X2 [Humulus lupulus]